MKVGDIYRNKKWGHLMKIISIDEYEILYEIIVGSNTVIKGEIFIKNNNSLVRSWIREYYDSFSEDFYIYEELE